jgi:hypothetical protein
VLLMKNPHEKEEGAFMFGKKGIDDLLKRF